MIIETHTRSLVKAASHRLFGTMVTIAIIFVTTRRLALSIGAGIFEMFSKTGLFFVHERLWHRFSFGRREIHPGVLWFTGLSGSGKSTLSVRVFEELERRGLRAEYLDGDKIRHLFPQTGFSKPERDIHIRRVGHMAASLEKHGVFVVASFVSPYGESRDFVRGLCRRFVEIHMSTPLEVCEKRDVKGLYAKARRGEIKNFTGIDDPYETPKSPEISVDTSRMSEDEAFALIMAYVDRHFIEGKG